MSFLWIKPETRILFCSALTYYNKWTYRQYVLAMFTNFSCISYLNHKQQTFMIILFICKQFEVLLQTLFIFSLYAWHLTIICSIY